SIANCRSKVHHIVYNDFSTKETRRLLEESRAEYHFELIHLEDITNNPSPNYKLVLKDAQARALKRNVSFIIVESDVKVKEDTFERMLNFETTHRESGLIGAITIDEAGDINFPYLKFKNEKEEIIRTKRSLSF